eukprot:534347-Pelagomonas_calceolata.AAC.2
MYTDQCIKVCAQNNASWPVHPHGDHVHHADMMLALDDESGLLYAVAEEQHTWPTLVGYIEMDGNIVEQVRVCVCTHSGEVDDRGVGLWVGAERLCFVGAHLGWLLCERANT